jgi:hypothetical protein
LSRLRAPCIAILAILVASCAPTDPLPGRYALVYGVSRYVNAYAEGEFPNLTYSDDDARSVAALLESDGYAVRLRVDQEASRENLEADLRSLATTALPGDFVLVYFSGHGGLLSDFGLDPATVATYTPDSQWIFPYGAIDPAFTGRRLLSGDIVPERAISDRDLQGLVDALPCSRKLLIIDACNSGGFIEGGADVDALPPDYWRGVVIDRGLVFQRAVRAYLDYSPLPADTGLPAATALVLAAAGGEEPSYEYLPFGHGVFTYFLLEAATLGDLNGDGYLTALEAYAYVVAGIQESWNVLFSSSVSVQFLPRVSGGAVDLVLLRVP